MKFFVGVAKYLLFILNFVIVICGIVLISFGVIILINENKGIDTFTDFSVGGYAIAVGLITFIIAFLGCFGAIKENNRLLTAYAAVMVVLIVIQIILGILTIAMIMTDDGGIKNSVTDAVRSVFNKYVSNPSQSNKATVDGIQSFFECCGVEGPSYWVELPQSCCSTNMQCVPDLAYQKGCVDSFIDATSSNVIIIGIVALGFLLFEIGAVIFAFVVKSTIYVLPWER